MTQALFDQLTDWLQHGPVCVAAVIATQGAVPRRVGALMLVDPARSSGSVGGGLLESRVLARARELLASSSTQATIELELRGGAESAGICGGQVRIALRVWAGPDDRAMAAAIAGRLRAGEGVELCREQLGADAELPLSPMPRLLIIGAGHCGLALFRLAQPLGYEVFVQDARPDCFAGGDYRGATVLCGDSGQLRIALTTQRPVHAVLLNRDYRADIDSLRVLAEAPPAYLGMMGSQRRIREVLAALPDQARSLAHLEAPVGLEIGADTPEEIAISILARLIQFRNASVADSG